MKKIKVLGARAGVKISTPEPAKTPKLWHHHSCSGSTPLFLSLGRFGYFQFFQYPYCVEPGSGSRCRSRSTIKFRGGRGSRSKLNIYGFHIRGVNHSCKWQIFYYRLKTPENHHFFLKYWKIRFLKKIREKRMKNQHFIKKY